MALIEQMMHIHILNDVISTGNPKNQIDYDLVNMIMLYGKDIIESSTYQQSKEFLQHGNISVFEHSLSVTYISLLLTQKMHLHVNIHALVRGALLHDYFLYDWHVSKEHRLHGFTHAKCALDNASRDFDLNDIEKDIIEKHMFPLNIQPPKYKESMIVCMADKISATIETIYFRGKGR